MVKILYNGNHRNLKLAVNNVNNLLQQEYFYQAIQRHDYFLMSDITPKQLSGLMRISDIRMTIELYYSVYPFSKSVTYDDTENPFVIHLNKWNLNRSVESICNTLMHQCIHAVNAMFPQFYFGHGDGSSSGKENTAPYWVASLAQRLISDDNSLYEALDHEEVSNIPFLQNFCVIPGQQRRWLVENS
jgi:hypothetical protein